MFHDNLIAKLKALSQIQLDFERRCKDAEGRYSDKLADLKKQMDHRWRQIDKFESSLKTAADAKLAWKRKFSAKDGELEALKVRAFRFIEIVFCILSLIYPDNEHRTLRSTLLPPASCCLRIVRTQIAPSPRRQRRTPSHKCAEPTARDGREDGGDEPEDECR